MISLKLNNEKLEHDFLEIVKEDYKNDFDLALTEAIERFVLSKKPPDRARMTELVNKFREDNKGRKNKSKIIEDTIKRYRLEHEKKSIPKLNNKVKEILAEVPKREVPEWDAV